MNTLEVALFYNSLGISCIPWAHKDKGRCLLPSWDRYKLFLPTEEEIRKWFTGVDCGIAIVTGGVSNLTVIDDDLKDGQKRLNSACVVHTGGGGYHYYYKYTPLLKGSVNTDIKLDIRNDGNLAFAYPTIHESGKVYEFENGIESLRNLEPIPLDNPLLNTLQQSVQKDRKEKSERIYTKGYGEFFDKQGIGERDKSLKDFSLEMWKKNMSPGQVLSLARLVNKTYSVPLPDNKVVEKVESTFRGLGERKNHTIAVARRDIPEPILDMIVENAQEASLRSEKELKEYAELPELGVPILSEFFKFKPKSLIVLAGDTGMGKTPFCAHFAASYAMTGKKVLFAPIETGSGYVSKIMLDDLGDNMVNGVTFLTFADGVGNIDTFFSNVERLFENNHYDLVILDHIHFISKIPTETNEDETISHISEVLRKIASRFNTCVFASAQLNKPDTSRFPNKHDIRFGRKLIQDASIVMIIHKKMIKQEEFGKNDDIYESNGLLILDKNRMTHVTRMIPFNVKDKKLIMDWNATSAMIQVNKILSV